MYAQPTLLYPKPCQTQVLSRSQAAGELNFSANSDNVTVNCREVSYPSEMSQTHHKGDLFVVVDLAEMLQCSAISVIKHFPLDLHV